MNDNHESNNSEDDDHNDTADNYNHNNKDRNSATASKKTKIRIKQPQPKSTEIYLHTKDKLSLAQPAKKLATFEVLVAVHHLELLLQRDVRGDPSKNEDGEKDRGGNRDVVQRASEHK